MKGRNLKLSLVMSYFNLITKGTEEEKFEIANQQCELEHGKSYLSFEIFQSARRLHREDESPQDNRANKRY